MAATVFSTPGNNVSTIVGPGGYTAGSGQLLLANSGGSLFSRNPLPSGSGQHYRVTVIKKQYANYTNAPISSYTIYKATAINGDLLTLSYPPIEGTTDQSYSYRDVVEIRLTAGCFSDLYTAVNNLELNGGGGGVTPTGSANTVLAGPTSGGSATMTARALVSNDIPTNLALSGIPTGNASSLTVTPTGATTARSLALLHSQVFRVKSYGAVGDGTTDDTLAIQACMDAAALAGGTVMFDRTTSFYNITSHLSLKTSVFGDGFPKIKIPQGDGRGGNQIFQLKYQNMYPYKGSAYIQDFVIDGLNLDGSWNGDSTGLVYNINEYDHGIAVQGISNLTIRNCRISNVVGDCINIGRTTLNSIPNTPTRILVEDCQLINPWRNGLQTGFNIDLTVRRCHVEKPGIYNFGFDIESDNNYTDGTDPNTGVNVGDTTGIVIEDCYFMGTGIDSVTGYPVPANAPFLQIANHNSTADIINVRISDNTVITSTRAIGVTGATYNVPPYTLRGFVSNLAIERNIFAGKQSSNPTTWTSPAGPLPDDYTAYIKYTRGCISISDNFDTNDSLYGWLLMGLSTGARISGNTFAPQTSRRQIGIAIDSGSASDGGTSNYNGPCLVADNKFYGLNSPVVATPPSVSPATSPSVSACVWITGNNSSVAENHTIVGNTMDSVLNGIYLDAPTLNNILISGNHINSTGNSVWQATNSSTVQIATNNVFVGGGVYNNLGGTPQPNLMAFGTFADYSDLEGSHGIGWAPNTNCTVSRSTRYAAHGSNSLEIKSTGAGVGAVSIASASISGCLPGIPYYASLMIRAAEDGAPRNINMRLNAYDVNNNSLTWNNNLRTLTADSTSKWSLMSMCGISPAGTSKIFISINIGTTGSYPILNECHYIDMITLTTSGKGLVGAAVIQTPWYLPGGTPRVSITGTGVVQTGSITDQELKLGSQGVAAIQMNVEGSLSGTGGTVFGDGLGNVVASISSSGDISSSGGSLIVKTGSGAPVTTPSDGAMYLDTVANKLYLRSSGAWKSVSLS